MMLNRLHVVAFITVIPMITSAADLPTFDAQFLKAYQTGIQTMVNSGRTLSPRSQPNNALNAYCAENERISKEKEPSAVVPDTRRLAFASLWNSLCRATQYQLARQTFTDSACQPTDRAVFMKAAATCAGELLVLHGVKFGFTESANTPEGHRKFLQRNKDISEEGSEHMLAGSVALYALGFEAQKIMEAKAPKVPTGEAKQ